jgi:hypothetical protein
MKKLKNMTTFATLHNRRGSKEPRILRGKRRLFSAYSFRPVKEYGAVGGRDSRV